MPNPNRKGVWTYVTTVGGAGIECSICHHKIGAKAVVMGDVNLNTCKFCGSEMKPISQMLLNRMKDEYPERWY